MTPTSTLIQNMKKVWKKETLFPVQNECYSLIHIALLFSYNHQISVTEEDFQENWKYGKINSSLLYSYTL